MDISSIPLENPGIVITDIPKSVYANLKDSIALQIQNRNKFAALKNVVHHTVMGIEESIQINVPNDTKIYLEDFAKKFYEHYNMSHTGNISLQGTWLNLQKKHEFRPYHVHYQTDLSFVIYYQVPYLIEDEDNHPNHRGANIFRNGRIEFLWYNLIGKPQYYAVPADKKFEGKMLIFPSLLYHMVYPFYTSDEYRITLAGNIKVT
jgi:hypothetical protein